MWYNPHFKRFRLFNSFNIFDSILTFYPCVNLSENPFASSFSLTAPSFHTYCLTTLRHKETGRGKAASLEIHKSLNSASEKHHAVASSNFQPLTALFDNQLSLAQQHILHPHLSFLEESFHTGKGKSNTSSTPTSTSRSLTHDQTIIPSIHRCIHQPTQQKQKHIKPSPSLKIKSTGTNTSLHPTTESPRREISPTGNPTLPTTSQTHPIQSNFITIHAPHRPQASKHPTTSLQQQQQQQQTPQPTSLTNSQPGRPSHTDTNTREYSNNLYHYTHTYIHTKATKNHHRTILPTVSQSVTSILPTHPTPGEPKPHQQPILLHTFHPFHLLNLQTCKPPSHPSPSKKHTCVDLSDPSKSKLN
ncbi:uncharacterized protein RSE6_04958 [Rhynchosporium secalis]|uniref:Uncharacterized protein n=1 Tax=Rhynchosporium secalis TaxID=38038 RepID=A0A1E1M6L6_RHYSE|nr:uncharacterized protein RSE6_04958 [Rhynchosporium secalis]